MPHEADDRMQLRDEHLVAYMQAYEDFLTSQLEFQAALKEGFFGLTKARRDLSRSRNTGTPVVGALQFPQEIEAITLLERGPAEPPHGPELRVVRKEAGEAAPDKQASPEESAAEAQGAAAPEAVEGAGRIEEAEERLRELGIGEGLSREIANALRDSDDPLGLTCGDTLVIDGGRDGAAMRRCSLRSEIRMAPSGLGALRDAQFASLLRDGGDNSAPRPSAQRPSPANDPVRWFSVMPPPALKKAQSSFGRAVELAAHIVNLQDRMRAAASRLQALDVGSA